MKRGCDLLIWSWVHIHFCGNGFYWFRPYGVSLSKSAKVTKALLPHHSAPRLGSVCPHSGIAPRVAAMGRPWPSAAKPASLPVYPLRNTCVRPAWLTGRPRSQPGRGGLRADQGIKPARCACVVYTSPCRSRLAGDGVRSAVALVGAKLARDGGLKRTYPFLWQRLLLVPL